LFSIPHFAELLSYPARRHAFASVYRDIWDGKCRAKLSPNDILFLSNYDPFNPFGMATKYSCASFCSMIMNAPPGVRQSPIWLLPSLIVPGPRKPLHLRAHFMILVAEARYLRDGM
jgi:hypothetical protein